jgi:hypothetical protein
MSRRSQLLLPLTIAALTAGCSSSKQPSDRDTMTQRQKDSVLGQTGLPGSQGISKAMRAADSVKARQAQVDTTTPP